MTVALSDTAVDTPLEIGGRTFRSRVMAGTGKYRANDEKGAAIEG